MKHTGISPRYKLFLEYGYVNGYYGTTLPLSSLYKVKSENLSRGTKIIINSLCVCHVIWEKRTKRWTPVYTTNIS